MNIDINLHWIPIEKELPPYGEVVMVTVHGRISNKILYPVVYTETIYESGNKFYLIVGYNELRNIEEINGVIAWSYVPKPYMKQKE